MCISIRFREVYPVRRRSVHYTNTIQLNKQQVILKASPREIVDQNWQKLLQLKQICLTKPTKSRSQDLLFEINGVFEQFALTSLHTSVVLCRVIVLCYMRQPILFCLPNERSCRLQNVVSGHTKIIKIHCYCGMIVIVRQIDSQWMCHFFFPFPI